MIFKHNCNLIYPGVALVHGMCYKWFDYPSQYPMRVSVFTWQMNIGGNLIERVFLSIGKFLALC